MTKIWDLNLRHLLAVVSIYRLGTISAAAKAVHLSQPAITQALCRLEQSLGVTLFVRTYAGMLPTAYGSKFVDRIHAAFQYIPSRVVTMPRFRALILIDQFRNFPEASESAGLSVATLVRSINDLAVALRSPLIVRNGQFVAFTDVGARLVGDLRRAKYEIETGLSEIHALQGVECRQVTIGATPIARSRILPKAINTFSSENPGVKLRVVDGVRSDLVRALRDGQIDLVVGDIHGSPIDGDLVEEVIIEDFPRFYCCASHPLGVGASTIEEIFQYPFVLPPHGSCLHQNLLRFCCENNLSMPVVSIESTSVETIVGVLRSSHFITYLSSDQVKDELEAGVLHELGHVVPNYPRRFGITKRSTSRPAEIEDRFVKTLFSL